MGSPSRDSIHALFNICISMAICDLSEKNQHRCGELHGYDKIVLQVRRGRCPLHPPRWSSIDFWPGPWIEDKSGFWWLMLMHSSRTQCNLNVTHCEETSLIATGGGDWKIAHALNNGIVPSRTATSPNIIDIKSALPSWVAQACWPNYRGVAAKHKMNCCGRRNSKRTAAWKHHDCPQMNDQFYPIRRFLKYPCRGRGWAMGIAPFTWGSNVPWRCP